MAENFVTDLATLSAANQRVIKANAESQGVTPDQYLKSRGGVNPVTGKFGDSFNPNRDLTDAEYKAAVAGKSGAERGAAINAAIAAKNEAAGGGTGGSGGGGATPSGLKSEAQIAADAAAAERRADRQSAYDLLFSEFNQYGLGALVAPLKGLIVSGASPAEFTIKLRETPEYQKRFAANAKRITNGFKAIDEATYLSLEDSYQSILQNYGMPEKYYKRGELGVQQYLADAIAKNIDSVTFEERVMEGQKVVNANKEIFDAAKRFFPTLTDGDFLDYVLNPQNALSDIKRKVTAAEIGGAQMGAGLQATLTNAEQLAKAGVTGAQYQQAAPTISEASIRGGQLASIYKEDPYTQQTAEQAVLNTPGSAAAIRQTKKLAGLETAAFSGQSGRGAIDRERAGGI
jgi:hypothetical protein